MAQRLTIPLSAVEQPPPTPEPASGRITIPASAAEQAPPTFTATSIPGSQTFPDLADDPNTIGTLVHHFWQNTNPMNLLQLLPLPKSMGGSGYDNPLNPLKIIDDHFELVKKGDELRDKGDVIGATAKYVESLVPWFGPAVAHWREEADQGKWAAVAGDMLGSAAGAYFLPKVAKVVTKPVVGAVNRIVPDLPGLGGPKNTIDARAADYAAREGAPIDAATATGSKFLRAQQKRWGSTWGGFTTAEGAQDAMREWVTNKGEELANQAHPEPATGRSAMQAVDQAGKQLIQQFADQQRQHYGTVEAIEAAPENLKEVPRTKTPKAMQMEQEQWAQRAVRSLDGDVPNPAELQELRRIQAEMESMPYVKRTWVDRTGDVGKRGNAAGGDFDITPSAPGASVYHDIGQFGGGGLTRGEVMRSIRSALDTGHFTQGAKAALEVARKRIGGSMDVGKPELPPEAGLVQERAGDTQLMPLPVNMTMVKRYLQPVYSKAVRNAEFAAPVGTEARALQIMGNIVNGPDHVPLSVADQTLSELKGLSGSRVSDAEIRGRAEAMHELRTPGQGLAAYAIRHLETEVRNTLQAAPGGGMQALELGRAATRGKYTVASIMEELRDSAQQSFEHATARRDTAFEHLSRLQEIAPAEVPKIGRALLDEMVHELEQGGLDRVKGVNRRWQKLGDHTKELLYRDPQYIRDLTDFFQLAENLGTNPNPSGTAAVSLGQLALSLPGYAITKLLYSPKGVRTLVEGIRLNRLRSGIAAVPGRAALGTVRLQAPNETEEEP
jgi:hypothetical protein